MRNMQQSCYVFGLRVGDGLQLEADCPPAIEGSSGHTLLSGEGAEYFSESGYRDHNSGWSPL